MSEGVRIKTTLDRNKRGNEQKNTAEGVFKRDFSTLLFVIQSC